MSHDTHRTTQATTPLERGLSALHENPRFEGTVEPMDGLDDLNTCEHLALFYRSREERFATVGPFVRQGIANGERVLYVIDRLTETEVIDELRTDAVDVDAAIERGQLTFHTLEETYLRTGKFDCEDMLSVYRKALADAAGEYNGIRVTANTNWILDESTVIEEFMEYESRVNELFRGTNCIALCHYDCRLIPPEILVDVIRTHPHLVYESTVCHNFYYTPPEEFLAPEPAERDVERMLGTLVDRSRARAELYETIEELEESNDRLKRFAYTASHDLQEPLRMISSYLQLLERRYGDDLDEEANEYIGFAVDGADRMREMVDGLLAYAQVDMDDSSYEVVDCNDVIDGVVSDLQLQLEECNGMVRTEDFPRVHGNANQIEMVFANLISNAIKYVDDTPPRVEITGREAGPFFRFAISDNGIGIDEQYHEQIFEIFNRLHPADAYEGTGIGLSLCRKIVRHHGGDIEVDSAPSEGTTFYVTLPLAKGVSG